MHAFVQCTTVPHVIWYIGGGGEGFVSQNFQKWEKYGSIFNFPQSFFAI